MKSLARLYVWWPAIDKAIENKVSNCDSCRELQINAPQKTGSLWDWPDKPWTRICADFCEYKQNKFVVIVDSYSKWPIVFDMKNDMSASFS